MYQSLSLGLGRVMNYSRSWNLGSKHHYYSCDLGQTVDVTVQSGTFSTDWAGKITVMYITLPDDYPGHSFPLEVLSSWCVQWKSQSHIQTVSISLATQSPSPEISPNSISPPSQYILSLNHPRARNQTTDNTTVLT